MKKTIVSIYYRLILWSEVISSIKFNKKPLLIFNYQSWHIGIDYHVRKRKYKKLLISNGYNVIHIDFNSRIMLFVLDIMLNGLNKAIFGLNKENIYNITTSKFLLSYRYSYWDLFLRGERFSKIGIPNNRNKYKELFYQLTYKRLKGIYWSRIYSIFSSKKIDGLILTQQSYEEMPLARFSLDNNIKVIYFEAFNGIEVLNPTYDPIVDMYSRAFNASINTLSKTELQKHKSILDKRIMGVEKDSERIFSKDISKVIAPVKMYPVFEYKVDRVVCLYLACFTDSPNFLRDTNDYSPFLDYLDLALYIVEYCAKNKIPMIIKPHPESPSYEYDKYYLESLRKATSKYKESQNLKVDWVGDDFTSINLTRLSNPLVVSARGTVISECGYLGIPTITFSKSPWMDLKNLTFLAKSTTDFERLMPIIDQLYNPKLAKKEGVMLSAMLDRCFKRSAFKITIGSKTSGIRPIQEMWDQREIL